MNGFTLVLFALVFVAATNPTDPAHAYLDPGTGAMILQALIGGVAGALVVGRMYWARIKNYFAPSKTSQNGGQTLSDK